MQEEQSRVQRIHRKFRFHERILNQVGTPPRSDTHLDLVVVRVALLPCRVGLVFRGR